MRVSSLLIACSLIACGAGPFAAPNPEPKAEQAASFVSDLTPKLDLLFVVDNSGSMESEQKSLRQEFKHMMEAFEQRAGVADLHVAVVSTDVGAGNIPLSNGACSMSRLGGTRTGGDRGELQAPSHCGVRDGARFLASQPGGKTNFVGRLPDVFSCIADLGTAGCGFEHSLLAARLALDEAQTKTNVGFLRKDAALGIVFVTDEDDCSAPPDSGLFSDQSFSSQEPSLRCALKGHVCRGMPLLATPQNFSLSDCAASDDGGGALYPVQKFVDYVKGLKADPNRIFVSAIAGWPETAAPATYGFAPAKKDSLDLKPVCVSTRVGTPEGDKDTAFPALRIKRFIDAFGDAGHIESICQSDLRQALATIGGFAAGFVGNRCVNAPLADTDDAIPGVQPFCEIFEVSKAEDGQSVSDRVVKCTASSAKPCWRYVTEIDGKAACAQGQGAIEIERTSPPHAGAMLDVRCEACVEQNPHCKSTSPAPLP
ncbi:MAG: hypothetical protein SF187_03515 [Deltaproteobacteria bacterium]|nr:hypothetical protein [Deltaproteobacteria bacterium]